MNHNNILIKFAVIFFFTFCFWGSNYSQSVQVQLKPKVDKPANEEEQPTQKRATDSLLITLGNIYFGYKEMEYKILRIEDGNSHTILDSLNVLGRQRWDCYWIDIERGWFYLKRPRCLIEDALMHFLKFLRQFFGIK